MTSAEFTESLAFEELEPDPAEVTMHLTAQVLALFANVYRDKGAPLYVPADFLPGGDRQQRLAQGTAQAMTIMAQYAAHRREKQN